MVDKIPKLAGKFTQERSFSAMRYMNSLYHASVVCNVSDQVKAINRLISLLYYIMYEI